MISRLYKSVLICTLIFSSVFTTTVFSQEDDLLLLIPPIIASNNKNQQPEPIGIQKLKRLQGRWLFQTDSFDGSITFEEYYRFNSNTAQATSDPNIFTIIGDSSTSINFDFPWCDGGMITAYSTAINSYLILCDWGYPTTDLGDAFEFTTVNASFSYTHFFFIPSTGELSTGQPANGLATRISTTFRSPTNSPLNRQPNDNKSQAIITNIKQEKLNQYKEQLNSETTKRLSPEHQKIQEQVQKIIALQKDK